MSTIDFYNNKSSELIQRYDNAEMSSLHKLLSTYIPMKSKVLDIGFGSGRDLQYLHDNNYDIWGIDPSQSFVENAKERFTDKRNQFFEASLPFEKNLFELTKFDAVISIAVWMHLKLQNYPEAVKNIINVSKPDSMIIISYSEGLRAEEDGRYFENVNLDYLCELFSNKGFNLIETVKNEDGLSRGSLTWVTVIFKHD